MDYLIALSADALSSAAISATYWAIWDVAYDAVRAVLPF